MRLALFGSTGFIGTEVLRQALAAEHEVATLVRDRSRLRHSSDRITVLEGLTTDEAVVHRVLEGADAVISTLGIGANTRAAADAQVAAVGAIAHGMQATGVRRLVAVSGAGVTLPGEQKPLLGRIASAVVGLMARWVVDAKTREMELLVATDLEWTLVRPTRVRPGERTGTYLVEERLHGASSVTVGDVAEFMLDCAQDAAWVRQAPYITAGPRGASPGPPASTA